MTDFTALHNPDYNELQAHYVKRVFSDFIVAIRTEPTVPPDEVWFVPEGWKPGDEPKAKIIHLLPDQGTATMCFKEPLKQLSITVAVTPDEEKK